MSNYSNIQKALKQINLSRENKKINKMYDAGVIDKNDIINGNNVQNLLNDQFESILEFEECSSDFDDECLRMKKNNDPSKFKKIILSDSLDEKDKQDEVQDEVQNKSTNPDQSNKIINIENLTSNSGKKSVFKTKEDNGLNPSQNPSQNQSQNLTNINLDNVVEFTFKSGGLKYDFSGSFVNSFVLGKKDFQNNLISKYTSNARLQGKVIVQKDRGQKIYSKYLIEETYSDYLEKIKARDSNPKYVARDRWIYDIIDGKSEKDRIIYEDSQFVIVPNSDWDETNFSPSNVELIHLMAIPYDKSLRCLRSLDASHIPLLNHIKNNSLNTIKDIYGIKSELLKIYLHYCPSVYHLHIHFVNTNNIKDHCQTLHEYTHELDTVIFNLSIKSDYYQTIKLRLRNNGDQIV